MAPHSDFYSLVKGNWEEHIHGLRAYQNLEFHFLRQANKQWKEKWQNKQVDGSDRHLNIINAWSFQRSFMDARIWSSPTNSTIFIEQDIYWAQRAHQKWIQLGDKTPKIFKELLLLRKDIIP